jgi:hypothetical protein
MMKEYRNRFYSRAVNQKDIETEEDVGKDGMSKLCEVGTGRITYILVPASEHSYFVAN